MYEGLRRPRRLYTSNSFIREALSCISGAINDDVITCVRRSSVFALLCDECADISNKRQLLCYVRCMDGCIPKTSFLCIHSIQEANAEALHRELHAIIKKKQLELSKLCAFTSDGASVFTGKHNGAHKKLATEVPGLITTHCVCHRLSLAILDAAKEVDFIHYNFKLFFRALYNWFDNSPNRFKYSFFPSLLIHSSYKHFLHAAWSS